MCTEEIRKLRYCHNVLHNRIKDKDDGLTYWHMNMKIATYFLRRYDADFDPKNLQNDETLLDAEKSSILATHDLLQRPTSDRRSYPSLTKELKLQLKKRVTNYFDKVKNNVR